MHFRLILILLGLSLCGVRAAETEEVQTRPKLYKGPSEHTLRKDKRDFTLAQSEG